MRLSRRQLLALLPGCAATLSLGSAAGLAEGVVALDAEPLSLFGDVKFLLPDAPLSMDEWEAMTPVEMARRSPLAVAAAAQCRAYAESIEDANLRGQTLGILDNPTPTFFFHRLRRKWVQPFLEELGYDFKAFPWPMVPAGGLTSDDFLAAPGSHWKGHHAYPGGLALHLAANTGITLGVAATYEERYGLSPNRDLLIAAQLLHDCMKPWVLQWRKDGSCQPEGTIADTSAHHVLSLAEVYSRRINVWHELMLLMACAHGPREHPKTGKGPWDWMKIAERLNHDHNGLSPLPDLLPVECYIVHQGDGDWPFTSTAATACRRFIERLAVSQYGIPEKNHHSRRFNTLRNALCSTLSMERLYALLQTRGEAAASELAARIVKPSA